MIINRAKRKEKKRIAEFHRQQRYDMRKERLTAELSILRTDMTDKPCALRHDFMNCTDECVHFKKGGVFDMFDFDDGDAVCCLSKPACRLWK
jgi:hypothetical protein